MRSYASLHKLAVREALDRELAEDLLEIELATHVAIYRGGIYQYGSREKCETFADGLAGVHVREITREDRASEAEAKRRIYRR